MKTTFTYSKRISTKLLLPLMILLLSSFITMGQTLHMIEVRDTEFDPATLEIAVGDTVEWNNVLGTHNVNGTQSTFPDNPESFGNDVGEDWTYRHIFTIAGEYSYRCDPHTAQGMAGTISVKEESDNGEQYMLTVDFSEMTPHDGQDFYLAVTDSTSGMEIGRVHTTAEVEFSVEAEGISEGNIYHVDFWADHNDNGMYDAPPTDHAWRIRLTDVTGDTTLTFVHNTNFTDIMWKNMLSVEFSGMNPHVGQDFYLAVTDTSTGIEVDRVHLIADVEFTVNIAGIDTSTAYNIDFWADHNGNGMYDAPPADHAWRLELDSIMGDTTLIFEHNTDFTDIMWRNKLTVEFRGMNPHVGQLFNLYVVDTSNEMYLDTITIEELTSPDFDVHSFLIEQGGTYNIDFWADHNGNSEYDAPPTDHAWRLVLENATGDTTLTFSHNTDFTDIFAVTSVDIPGNRLFRMYPIPASDKVFIETDEINMKEYTLAVYDISGRLKTVENTFQNNRIELNTGKLTKGMYFIHLKSPTANYTLKLIKK